MSTYEKPSLNILITFCRVNQIISVKLQHLHLRPLSFLLVGRLPANRGLSEEGRKEQRNTVKQNKANWIVHILCKKCKCLLKHVREGKIERKSRRRKRRKQLLDNFTENRIQWILKEEALDRTL